MRNVKQNNVLTCHTCEKAHLHTNLHVIDSLQDVMEDMLDLLDLRKEVMERVENVLNKAISYQQQFDCYAHLWQDNRAEFLSQFLLYARALTPEEAEAHRADILPGSPPTVDHFKEQVKGVFAISVPKSHEIFINNIGLDLTD